MAWRLVGDRGALEGGQALGHIRIRLGLGLAISFTKQLPGMSKSNLIFKHRRRNILLPPPVLALEPGHSGVFQLTLREHSPTAGSAAKLFKFTYMWFGSD